MDDATPAQLTYLEELELLRVRRSAGVVPDSITLTDIDGGKVLHFDLQTEQIVGEAKADIRDVETVELEVGPVTHRSGTCVRFGSLSSSYSVAEKK